MLPLLFAAAFADLWKPRKLQPFLNCALHVAVSGHRVKVEDPQKMQFSNRLSEFEHYQRSVRIGTANNNARPIHQAHLSTTQGELIPQSSPHHPLSCKIEVSLKKRVSDQINLPR